MVKHSATTRFDARLSSDGLYGRWAPLYDLIFDLPFHPGRSAAARAASDAAGANGEILVLGLLPRSVRVVGIDLSSQMLTIARERVARKGLRQIKALQVMDAAALEF